MRSIRLGAHRKAHLTNQHDTPAPRRGFCLRESSSSHRANGRVHQGTGAQEKEGPGHLAPASVSRG